MLALLCMIAARGERDFVAFVLNVAASAFFLCVIVELWRKRRR